MINSKDFIPNILVGFVVEEVIFGAAVNLLEPLLASKEDLVGEVEENLSEDHHVSMIEGEVKASVFAAGGMGGDQNAVETLGIVQIGRRIGNCASGSIEGPLLKS